ncbi:MAG: c-type cytochrome [Gammaproteobacteria bacterium]|nr:c-type cytochrome [Gammaproteobacteria bacterium]MBL6998932.1 c-type cytochrome [Gammaproteobacteria bacterium]
MHLKLPFLILFSLISTHALGVEYDPGIGEEINEVCAGCHGEFGQGGKEGEYPRLAGMPALFIAQQLELFRDRKRPNLAMIEYIDERQMPAEDILHISHYLAGLKLNTRLPAVDETADDFDAYARLLESKKLMQIPRAEGDIETGEKLYKKECASCHGSDGYGDEKKVVPMLAGQYTDYLWRQVEKLRNRIRIHDVDDPKDELLDAFTDAELADMFAWLSTADD